MVREVIVFVGALSAFAAAIAAYLAAIHGEAGVKEVLSTTFAAVIGLYVGRLLERNLARG